MLLWPLAAEETPSPADNVDSLREWFVEIDWTALGLTIVTRAIVALAILVIAFFVVKWARRVVRGWVSKATARGLTRAGGEARQLRVELRAKTLGDVMADVTGVLVWVIAVFTALGTVGIELGPLIAGAGIAGVALGFGAQSLVKDFLSGFFILLEDQFGIGDVIQIDPDVGGIVEDVSLRVTRLRSLDGTVWFVPNGEVRYLGNMSKEWARALVDFQVAYDADIDDVIEVIRGVATGLRTDEELAPKILEDVEILGVEQLAESGVTIRTFIKTVPLEQWTVSRRFRQAVKQAFDERGIEIPFPHRKLIIQDGTPPAPKAPAPEASSRVREGSAPEDAG